MSYKKRESPKIVRECEIRLGGMQQIDQAKMQVINYGHDTRELTSVHLAAEIAMAKDINIEYNKALQKADELYNAVTAKEDQLRDMYTEILAGAKGKFGVDSSEYEILGGTRASERKPRTRTTTTPNP